ncbi:MAG: LytTR family DNA-binding domain-containing protein [Clostridia bacterium]|nr:LytTR family DNA-binding domain-containing protein [Clostridia bacterium]
MNITICDDSREYIGIIENYIESVSKSNYECDAYESGEDLIAAYVKEGGYDVIFLDMEMKKLNGIDTANKIREIDEHVIIVFITSHTEYMRESFKCLPFRFLVKPVEIEEFNEVYGDICKKLSGRRKTFAFTENRARVILYCDDIIYCESFDHWVMIHTRDEIYKLREPLNEIYSRLDRDMFCRVHKSFVINFRYVKSLKKNDAELYHCGELIPISRSCKKSVLDEYANFLERDLYI